MISSGAPGTFQLSSPDPCFVPGTAQVICYDATMFCGDRPTAVEFDPELRAVDLDSAFTQLEITGFFSASAQFDPELRAVDLDSGSHEHMVSIWLAFQPPIFFPH